MKKLPSSRAILTGAVLSLLVSTPVYADDTEIYVGGSAVSAVAPNVLFAVDTSGSMGSTVVTQGAYNPATDYSTLPTSCAEFTNDRIYWSPGSVNTSCTSAQWFSTTYMRCDASTIATTGFYQDRLARYHNDAWRTLSVDPVLKERNVECQSDSGVHGIDGVNTAVYAEDNSGDNTTGGWSTNSSNEINWQLEGNYTVYSANFMNYLRSDPTAIRTRLDIVQDVVANVVNSVNGINIGLMRFSQNQEGGQISFAMQDITNGRSGFIAALNAYTPSGPTPLTEVLWEAMRYYRGDAVDYGASSTPGPSVADSWDAATGNYISPIQLQCQRNSVILLTDGASNGDNGRDANLIAMPNYANATGETNCPHPMEHVSTDGDADDGMCLDQLAAYMANEDQLPALADDQFVQTYTIGFQLDMPLLNDTALEGEGLYFTADDTVGLTNAFTAIINEVLATDSTFTSPAVSVNAFSQTLNRNDLYFTLFRPEGGPHWDGNLKKYRLGFDVDNDGNTFPVILDVNNQPAINPNNGFFQPTAQSYWSAGVDGGDVRLGGAANVLTNNRSVHTFGHDGLPSDESFSDNDHVIEVANSYLTEERLGLPTGSTNPTRDELIQWMRGVDIDGDYGTAGGARLQMGDPLHSQATVVQYGGTPASPDLTIFFSSNDGYLHAIDESDGTEIFSFVPRELLSMQYELYQNNAALQRPYGLDGAVVSWVNDDNGDGVISGVSEHVFIYVGMRRGGSNYYAFDVTDRSAPELKWMITNDTDGDGTPDGNFAELGQTWSTPVVREVLFNGVLTTVLVFGGGYDADQDDNLLPQDDDVGRAIYVVDADTGQRLWWAGPAGSGADLELTNMTNSIPAQVNAVDISGNGVVDRLYVGDTRAQFWRIDINENNSGASSFATGGRIASFAENDQQNNRRFYHAADLAVIAPIGRQPYIAIVVGTGYRAHPLNTEIQDRIYMLKDTDIFSPPATYVTLDENDLFDATNNVIGEGNSTDQAVALGNLQTAGGWYIVLEDPPTSTFIGEKVLGRPLIVSGTAVVPSFIPNDPNAGGPVCGPNEGIGLLYFLNVADATPVRNYDNAGGETDLTRSDRTVQLTRGGITPSPTLIIAEDSTGTTQAAGCAGTDCFGMPNPRVPTKTYWYEF
ncbi:MAG: PilC/PilY family type IV pilus protein [Gammaproteobacteria bacterium]|nr:PilC/PilY family type IV pilus protein [Gammaproteobacteria bacterium]